ncbi:hypothetical protein [Sphingomonas sp. PAMC 26605]|uniref:hypothetical protein n=1 Tax=Sphingomonas sp. PAMC 26605 TaxID=1112214 RepID=UPI00026CB1A4|nr:hypothetical protein [Sphingomonas sp. PAMC 26605]
MKVSASSLAFAGCCALFGVAVYSGSGHGQEPVRPPPPANPIQLRSPSEFVGIASKQSRSVALFQEAGKVIQSPRCMNCHPRTDRPTQTDAMIPHQPLALRGPDGHGPIGGVHCKTCHGDANVDPAGVPGNPKWGLAPAIMAWQGKTLGQICRQIKDPKRNGGKSLTALITHFSEDDLVGWGWHPGGGRIPAPGTQKQMGAIIKAWVDTGAACPKS